MLTEGGGGMKVGSASQVSEFDVSSCDPDVADVWLRAAYVDYRRRLHGDLSTFRFAFTGASVPSFSIATVHHGMGFECETDLLDDAIVVNTTLAGRIEVATGRTVVVPTPGVPYLMPPGRPWTIQWEQLTNEAVRIDRPVLERAAAGMGGDGEALRFTGSTPSSPEWASYLRAVTAHVRDEVLGNPDTAAHPLALAEAARSLAVATLLSIPNNAVAAAEDLTTRERPGAEPAVVRRAVEFMDANAHREVDVAQVADAAHIGIRGLQAAFRRHRDQTPLEYLRRVRLEQAHRDLQAADPAQGLTVAAIAARWGFTHPGRFSVDYRRAYGLSPRQTLKN
ncbi:AraC family transcriptional regulator [Actinomycetospora sp. TBRC 11914]|uniref:AraC family transcriptional regulator n=1 Tax=Actinomycetospora sp. TBRC 11914 TaxID=2729387 RepID=UPI00145E38AC|nr:helix-turn-helix domain-containing protein [Actinomycetospora sp. TBRC 11914]NMO94085.1 AraC family transcriptional regulator [Actinomycetospora sp. TBRC 11914]